MTKNFTDVALRISSGVILWGLHFGVVYGLTAVACARGNGDAVPWIIGSATIIAAAAIGALMVHQWRRRAEFEAWLSATIAAFALLAVFFEGLTFLIITPCR